MEQRDITRQRRLNTHRKMNGKYCNVQYGDGKNEVMLFRRASPFFGLYCSLFTIQEDCN